MEHATRGESALSESPNEQRMKHETILVLLLGLLLLVLFLVTIVSDAVAVAALPALSRNQRGARTVGHISGRHEGQTVCE